MGPRKRAAPQPSGVKRKREARPADTSDSPTPRKRFRSLNPLPLPPTPSQPPATLWLWGDGDVNRLGLCPWAGDGLYKPRKNSWLKTLDDILLGAANAELVDVQANGMRSVILDKDGALWSWGAKDSSALGRLATDDNEAIPCVLRSLVDEHFRVARYALGNCIGAALNAEGDLRVWGTFKPHEGGAFFSPRSKSEDFPIDVFGSSRHPKLASIAAGFEHLLALTVDGQIYSWGVDEDGRLGRAATRTRSTERHSARPSLVPLDAKRGKGKRATVIGAGSKSSYAVDEYGDVWGWGLNGQGETGTGYPGHARETVPLPKKVLGLSKAELKESNGEEGLEEEIVVQIVGGSDHTLFLTSRGRVFSCGGTIYGQLGLPSDHPAISRRKHSMETVTFYDTFVAVPTLVAFPISTSVDPIQQLAVGDYSNLAISRDGAVYVWGSGEVGELGLGDAVSRVDTPTVLVRSEGGSWRGQTVACAGRHCLGLFAPRSKD